MSVTVIRPAGVNKPVPALLQFTARGAPNYAMECAAHGYAGIVAITATKRKSAAGIDPFEYAGADAREVINWIAEQAWSDGRVGMYGDAYSAYAPWAAAKQLPKALKAIATSVSMAPGIDFPMEGNIIQNSAYGWSLQMADADRVDDPTPLMHRMASAQREMVSERQTLPRLGGSMGSTTPSSFAG